MNIYAGRETLGREAIARELSDVNTRANIGIKVLYSYITVACRFVLYKLLFLTSKSIIYIKRVNDFFYII